MTDVLSVLIWVRAVCKSYQKPTNVTAGKGKVKLWWGCFLKNYFPLYVIGTHIMKHLKSDVVETLKLRSVSIRGYFTNQKRGKNFW